MCVHYNKNLLASVSHKLSMHGKKLGKVHLFMAELTVRTWFGSFLWLGFQYVFFEVVDSKDGCESYFYHHRCSRYPTGWGCKLEVLEVWSVGVCYR